ncbi:hypothetical protein GKE82_05900 [Conexibacter sp. W3-3-2]|uniref:hypothetical protein n=1 Tax=Conexibacter sp. W3-3-2 TaxID=2675227 RepID=UPI0012B7A798|nr:hypothetical protein [Conexibacter sp. W3-3-2]MTD43849.1 hypothetical protein [Conexibacter sp. W3-3-2]
MRDPIARARAARTSRQAAKLINEITPELALNDDLPPGWEQDAEEALRIVNERFPDAEEVSYQLDTPTTTSRRAKANLSPPADREQPRKSAAAREGSGAPAKAKAPARPSPGRAPGRAPARRGRGGAARRAWRATGVPAATGGLRRTALNLLGMAMGLVFLYLVVSRPKGVQVFARGTAAAARGFIAPVDPLRPGGWSGDRAKPKPTKSSPARPTNGPTRTTAPSPVRTR